MAHTISDLESCYDRQLPNLEVIFKELIRFNRNSIRLITKVLPRIDHSISTWNGLNKEWHGGK